MSPDEARAIGAILRGRPSPTIVELGAHVGEEAETFHKYAPNAFHVMVEPDPDNLTEIRRRWGQRPNTHILGAAIADQDGKATFFRSFIKGGTRGSGSILDPSPHIAKYPDVEFNATIEVQTITLDSLAEMLEIHHIDLLYVDIQGAESKMIDGGRHTLCNTEYLFIEAEKIPIYKGQLPRVDLVQKLQTQTTADLGAMWVEIGDFDYNLLFQNVDWNRSLNQASRASGLQTGFVHDTGTNLLGIETRRETVVLSGQMFPFGPGFIEVSKKWLRELLVFCDKPEHRARMRL